jgi:hypothetical protein
VATPITDEREIPRIGYGFTPVVPGTTRLLSAWR